MSDTPSLQQAIYEFGNAFRTLAVAIEQYEQSIEQFKFSLKTLAQTIGNDTEQRDVILWTFHTKLRWIQEQVGTPVFEEWIGSGFNLTSDELQTIMERKAREALEARVSQLRDMPYNDYLQSPEWKERRELAVQRAGYRCQVCNAANVQLNVHHRTYERLGNELDEDLTVLCKGCHQIFHENGKLARRAGRS